MKKIAFTLMILVVGSTLFAQQLASSGSSTKNLLSVAMFEWEQTTYDFGKVKVNDPATHEFSFVNAGESPLIFPQERWVTSRPPITPQRWAFSQKRSR